ncbi:MAG: hypothetical protein N2662_12430 [Bacteroidales bacterium]|nr:hypothetical protein [Bacteroidales bacterium]
MKKKIKLNEDSFQSEVERNIERLSLQKEALNQMVEKIKEDLANKKNK